MRTFATWAMTFTLFAGLPAMAAGGNEKEAPPPKEAKPAPATPAPKEAAKPAPAAHAELEVELQQLRDLLGAQAQQIEKQRAALQEQQEKMAALEKRLRAAAASPALTVASAPPLTPAAAHGAPAARVAAPAAADPVAQDKKEEQPLSLHFKGITLTPGGFMAAETVWRRRALSADVNSSFNSIPFPSSSQARISEFNASGRQSRISMLAEGKASSAKLSGYYEGDFLSAGVTSNNNQSNSYTFRQRQFWGQAALDSGWTFTGGQMWSLVTETKKGVQPRTEAPPLTIDAQYTAGFSWARQYGFRVAKGFGDKFWLAMSVEGSQTTLTVHGNSNNFLIAAPGLSGGLFNSGANYSFNTSPDIIFKAAVEPGWGHYEFFGIVSVFRGRVFPNAPSTTGAFNDKRAGGGIGANARVPLFNKKLDAGIHFLAGDGIGRYGTTGLSDATARADGTLALIRGGQTLGTVEWHPTPKLDFYVYGGGEYAARTAFLNPGGTTGVGYGSPKFSNSACAVEVIPSNQNTPGGQPSACTGDTRSIIEGTIGFWYRFYKGDKGTLQWGPQYSYVERTTWSGASNQRPKTNDNMIFTSFRYYIP